MSMDCAPDELPIVILPVCAVPPSKIVPVVSPVPITIVELVTPFTRKSLEPVCPTSISTVVVPVLLPNVLVFDPVVASVVAPVDVNVSVVNPPVTVMPPVNTTAPFAVNTPVTVNEPGVVIALGNERVI